MGLLQPAMGLLFWMSLAFGIVLFVLCKWGFPVIVRSIEERKKFIDSSIAAAHEAQEKLERITETSQAMLEEAQAQRQQILRDVAQERERIIALAKEKAELEGARIVSQARETAEAEREEILREARSQVASLAIEIAEKLLRKQLEDGKSQTELAQRLLDEIEDTNKEA